MNSFWVGWTKLYGLILRPEIAMFRKKTSERSWTWFTLWLYITTHQQSFKHYFACVTCVTWYFSYVMCNIQNLSILPFKTRGEPWGWRTSFHVLYSSSSVVCWDGLHTSFLWQLHCGHTRCTLAVGDVCKLSSSILGSFFLLLQHLN